MDYIIGAIIILAITFAIYQVRKSKKTGGCTGCSSCTRGKSCCPENKNRATS